MGGHSHYPNGVLGGEVMKPQFICLSCMTVIGEVWDDDENTCKCPDQAYGFEVYRVVVEEEEKNED